MVMGMTFKQFRKWCNERACDGCWGYHEAILCIDVGREILKLPSWKREKVWKQIELRMLNEVIEPTNRKIQELRGDVERGRGSGK